MPSNKDLITSIIEEATTKSVTVPDTKDKSNVQLLEILKELKTPAPPVAPDSDDGTDADETESPVKEEEKPSYPYSVAEGKAITCKKGILSDGDEIKVEYVNGGIETLNKLVKDGYVIKK